MIELVHIGHSPKTRGIDGSFKIQVEDAYLEDLHKAKALFISLDGSKVPFILTSVDEQRSLVVKVEEINNPEAAQPLLGNEIFLHIDDVSEKELSDKKHALQGYTVLDQNENTIGTIAELMEFPDQLLAKITFNNKDILVPIHTDLIIAQNDTDQKLQLTIADGLLNL